MPTPDVLKSQAREMEQQSSENFQTLQQLGRDESNLADLHTFLYNQHNRKDLGDVVNKVIYSHEHYKDSVDSKEYKKLQTMKFPSYMTPANIAAVNKFDDLLMENGIGIEEKKKVIKELDQVKDVFNNEFDAAISAFVGEVGTAKATVSETVEFKDNFVIKGFSYEQYKNPDTGYINMNALQSDEMFRALPSDDRTYIVQTLAKENVSLHSTKESLVDADTKEQNTEAISYTVEKDNELHKSYEDLKTGVLDDVSKKTPRNYHKALKMLLMQKNGVKWTDDEKTADMMEDIYDNIKWVNVPAAFKVYNKKPDFDFSGETEDVKARLVKLGYKRDGYLYTGSEVKNIKYVFDALNNADNPKILKDALNYIQSAISAGMNPVEMVQQKRIIDRADKDSVVGLLLADLNYDGNIINLKEGESQKNVDKARILGGQIHALYKKAVREQGIDAVAKNIGSLVNLDVKNQEELIAALKNNPGSVIYLRNMMQIDSDNIDRMLTEGDKYASSAMKEIIRNQEAKKEKSEIVNKLVNNIPEEIKQKLDGKLVDLLKKDKVQRDNMIQTIRTQIKKLKDNNGDKTHIENLEKLDHMLTTINEATGNGEANIAVIPESIRRGFYISAVGLAYSNISIDGAQYEGASAGVAVSNDKWNGKLSEATNGILSNITLGGGIYKDVNTNALGYGLSLSTGGSKKLGETTTLFYNGGAAWSPQQPGSVMPFVTVGLDQLLNKKSLQQTLDYRSSQHLAGVATATVKGKPDVAVQLSWSRDKKEGLLIGHEKLVQQSKELFTKLLAAKDQAGREAALKKLFPRTSEEQVTQIAQSLEYTIGNYKEALKMEGATSDVLADRLGKAFATTWLNQGMKDIAAEGIHISQFGAGVSLLTAFKGFLGLFSMRVSLYKNVTAKEQLKNYNKNIEEGRGLDKEKGSLDDKLGALQRELGLESRLDYNQADHTITLPKEILKNTRVLLSKHLEEHVKTDQNGNLLVPLSATLTARTGFRSNFSEKVLIIGRTNTKDTLQLDSFEGKEGDPKSYGKVDTIKTANSEPITLDGMVNDTFIDNVIHGHASEIALLRMKGGKYATFHREAVAFFKEQGFTESSLSAFREQFGSRGVLDNVVAQITTPAELRYFYGSLSKVSQTEFKHLHGDAFDAQAHELWESIPAKQRPDQAMIARASTNSLTEADIAWLKRASGVDSSVKYMAAARTSLQKFAYMLLPMKDVILSPARTRKYEESLNMETDLTGTGRAALMALRRQSAENMGNRSTSESVLMENMVASVSGYHDLDDEKHVDHPRVMKDSIVSIEGSAKGDILTYAFAALLRQNLSRFRSIQKNFEEICSRAKIAYSTESDPNGQQMIDAFKTGTMGNAKVNIDLSYGIFAECLNDSLIMGNISMEYKTKKYFRGEPAVYTGDVVSHHVLDTQRQDLGLASVIGSVEKRHEDGTKPGTLKPKESEGETTPETLDKGKLKEFIDGIDGASANIDEVGKLKGITIGDKEYPVSVMRNPNDKNGSRWIVYRENKTSYVITKVGGNLSLNKVIQKNGSYVVESTGKVIYSAPKIIGLDSAKSPVISKRSGEAPDPAAIVENAKTTWTHEQYDAHAKKNTKKDTKKSQ